VQHVVVIRKIAPVDNYRLETDMCSASSGVDLIDNDEILREPWVGIMPVLVRYHVSFSTARSTPAVITSALAGVRTDRARTAFVSALPYTCVTKTLL
jgi:hypothetical protein